MTTPRLGSLLGLAVFVAGLAPGDGRAAVSDQRTSYLLRYFADVNDVSVTSQYATYDLRFQSQAALRMQWNHEVVVVAGVTAAPGTPEAVDAITTASRPISGNGSAFRDFSKVRNEVTADVRYRPVAAGYYISSESDYLAQLFKASVKHDFFDQNFTVAFSSSYGWDAIDPLADDDGGVDGPAHRRSWDWNAVASQVLTPTTVVHVGAELNRVEGLQHNPYRNVYAGGGPAPERHPDLRVRRDVYLDIDQYLKNRSSVTVSYRYYEDDWGVRSNTVAARLSQYITDDVVMEYRYRWYDQGPADFFRAEYATADGIDGFRTGDYRLGDFSAHLFGGRLHLNLAALSGRARVLEHFDWSLKYERYFNTNNFSADLMESGLVYRF